MARACAPWYSIIFPEKCDGCASYGKALVANPHKCVNGCTACEPLCHKKAIVFPKPQLAFTPIKTKGKGLLRKITCKKCGKVFWTNRESDLCFDCEGKR